MDKKLNVFDLYHDGHYEVVISDKETVAGRKPVLSGTSMTDIAGLLTATLQMPCVIYLDESVADDRTLDRFDCTENIQAVALRSDLDPDRYVPGPDETEALLDTGEDKPRTGGVLFSLFTDEEGLAAACGDCEKNDFQKVSEFVKGYFEKHARPQNTTVSAILSGILAFIGERLTPEDYRVMHETFFRKRTDTPVIFPINGSGFKS